MEFVELLRSQPPDQDFLVYDLYDLEPVEDE